MVQHLMTLDQGNACTRQPVQGLVQGQGVRLGLCMAYQS